MHNAFDYDSQTWVSGEAGRLLLLKQTQSELDLLTDPEHVEGFRKLIGLAPEHVEGYIKTMRAQMARLEAEGPKDA